MKNKYSPCFNCYKYYYSTGLEYCFASFPCKYLAEIYIDFYTDHIDKDTSCVAYYVKKQSVPHFILY